MRRNDARGLVLLLPMLAVIASACQGVLGIESWTQKPAGSCILASDCDGSQVCLFQKCSDPCAKDKDCSSGTYCLRTDDGSACVSSEQAQCGSQECPAGTVCSAGHCQATCDAKGALCPGGQECNAGLCVPNVPDAGNGGAGNGGHSGSGNSGSGNSDAGSSGSGNSGSGNANAGEGGSAGAAGTTDTAGAAGDLGEGGAPPMVIDDGTAIGLAAAPCSKPGALACAGHAQRAQLVCQNGAWQPNGVCSGATLCDSTPGANAGLCQSVIPECQDRALGYRFCRGTETDIRECGLDLVTATVVESCKFVCSAGACAGDCHPADKQCKTGGLIPQTCTDAGAWKDETACAYKCDVPTGKCLSATCGDKAKNGDETDTDCGGSCGGCGIGGACKGDGDCVAPASARCINGTCAAAKCDDGVKNGTETDKDCGGTCSQRCAVNQSCAQNGDCALPDSGHCVAAKCVAFSCGDGIKNGTETDKDCGGSCAADCGLGAGCGSDTDCSTSACLGTACVACKPLTRVCVNTSAQSCSATGTWDNPVPCTVNNGTPNCTGQGVCGIQSCKSGFAHCDTSLQNGCETDLNDPAACGTTCNDRVACSSVNGTPACVSGSCKPTCAPGYGDCNAASLNDGCERWLNSANSCGQSCSAISICNAPAQACSNGACVPNTPYTVGQASNTGFSNYTPGSDTWYVVPVTVPRNATVQGLRLLGSAAGGSARMALWADNGAGQPGAFIAQTINISVAVGVSGQPPVPLNTTVSAGKTYWLGAKFTGGAQIYQKSLAGAKVYTAGQSFGTVPSDLSPFPTSPGLFTDVTLAFFLLVQDIPQ